MRKNITSLVLFSLDGCTPCVMVKKQLERCPDWQKYVTIDTRVDDPDKDVAFDVVGYPTLIILYDDGTFQRNSDPSTMTKSYFQSLFDTIENPILPL